MKVPYGKYVETIDKLFYEAVDCITAQFKQNDELNRYELISFDVIKECIAEFYSKKTDITDEINTLFK